MSKSVLASAVENGSAVLAVCAGFQVVGASFPDAEGRSCDGLGLIDVVTAKGHGARCVGEVVSLPEHATLALVAQKAMTGFENHSGVTRLGTGVRPLGRVRFGVGNGDGSGNEGATSGCVVGTYMHGPVLARNPALADAILSMATGALPLALDDREEDALRAERLVSARAHARSGVSRRARALGRLVSSRTA